MAILALTTAACNTVSQMTVGLVPTAPAGDVRGTTVSFDSVDGPPPAVVQKVVRELGTEAAARQIVMVPRGGQAMYRVRGYLATHADQGQTAIAWAWDVYDGEERRVFRFRGEDKAGPASRSWAAADDQTLRRIARASMEQLVVFLGTARLAGGSVAEAAPQGAGIVRGAAPVSLALAAAPEARPGEVPPPGKSPLPGAAASPMLAYADPRF